MSHSAMGEKVEMIIPSELGQRGRDEYPMILLLGGI